MRSGSEVEVVASGEAVEVLPSDYLADESGKVIDVRVDMLE